MCPWSQILKVGQSQLTYIEIFSKGNVDDDTVFTFDDDTEVEYSCAATLNDEFWVIGGLNKKRQVLMKQSNIIPLGDFLYGFS